jgi:hypothetical protein
MGDDKPIGVAVGFLCGSEEGLTVGRELGINDGDVVVKQSGPNSADILKPSNMSASKTKDSSKKTCKLPEP